jgi:GNAT superfamily N-acetyltransferase
MFYEGKDKTCCFQVSSKEMVIALQFDTIFSIWNTELWPNRVSKIETHSAMMFDGSICMENFDFEPSFFGFEIDGEIVGVNSGHMCADRGYRSRGLWVYPPYRKKGIGRALLMATINQGRKENAEYVWSLPRQASWSVYESAGFILLTDWLETETGLNAYCRLDLDIESSKHAD